MFNFRKIQRFSAEEQIKILEQCGIRLNPGFTIDRVIALYGRNELERDPFKLTLAILGGDADDDEGGIFSDDVWFFDTECIEGDGSYVHIAENFRRLTQGDLPLENITDVMDFENDIAHLEFDLDGQHICWEATINDDWVDDLIISNFARLLATRDTGRRFTIVEMFGQDCIFGCTTSHYFKKLRRLTGLKMQWLR